MYAKAKMGGFLHLAIGEEATIVGSARAMRDDDYLISTYRSHGHAIVRGTSPNNVMAELFGRVDGCSKGRGGSMHMFDLERRFMGGYGIVGGNLPIAVGLGLGADYQEHRGRDALPCSATAPPTRARSARRSTSPRCGSCRSSSWSRTTSSAWAPRSSATPRVTDLHKRGDGFGVPGMRCDGMDVARHLRGHERGAAAARARSASRCSSRRSPTASAATRWPTPRSTAPRSRSRSGASATRSRPSASGSSSEERPRPRTTSRSSTSEAVATRRRGGRASPTSSPFPRARVALRRRLRARRPGRAAGTRSTSAPPACTAARTSATTRTTAPSAGASRAYDAGDASRPRSRGLGRATAADRRRPDADERRTARDGRHGAVMRYREALNEALREEMQRDERVLLMGEDIGVFNGAFKVTAGPARRVRREARPRHADLREHDRGRGRRRGDDRAAAGRRAHDGQLLAAGDGPDRQLGRAHPLHVRRPGLGPARRPDAAGRRPPARADALALLRGALPPRPGPARRRPVHPGRRQGPAQGGDPRRQPGRLHRARVPLRPARRGPRGRATSSTSAAPPSAARAPT